MAPDQHDRADDGVHPVRPAAPVLADPWEIGGPLWWQEMTEGASSGGALDVVPDDPDDGVPAWVDALDDPASAPAVIDPDGALLTDPDHQLDTLLAARTGPASAAVLALVDLATVRDTDLPDLAIAAARLESWAHAVSARIAGELASRPLMNPGWPAHIGRVARPGIAADELALRLNLGRRSAEALVDEGTAYRTSLPGTGDALRDGQIDRARARVMVQRLREVDPVTAAEVEARVLPGAPDRTAGQLRQDVDRALLAIDPEAAEARRARSRTGRHVTHPRALPDGMAGMWAVLPAPDAARLDHALDASAHALRRAGDDRTVAQLRADALVDAGLVGTGSVGTGLVGTGLVGTGSVGTGSVGTETRHIALATGRSGPATNRPALPTCRCALGTCRCALAPTGPGLAPDTPCDAADSCTASPSPSRSPLPAPHAAPHLAAGRPGPRTDVRVTVSLATLLGLDDAPADLVGLGPVDAVTARALAAGGTWRRIVTDPLSGAVLDVGHTRYRPPADLAAHVVARDRTCARPGCTVPAVTCDLDHTVPYDDGGTTSAANLGPLCRRDHLLKTHAGHRLVQEAPGRFVWTSALGERYRSVPGDDAAHHRLRRLAPPDASPPDGSPSDGSRQGLAALPGDPCAPDGPAPACLDPGGDGPIPY